MFLQKRSRLGSKSAFCAEDNFRWKKSGRCGRFFAKKQPPATFCDGRLNCFWFVPGLNTALFKALFHGALVFAQLLLAFAAAHGAVAAFIEPMRITIMSNLPAQQQEDRQDTGGEDQGAS